MRYFDLYDAQRYRIGKQQQQQKNILGFNFMNNLSGIKFIISKLSGLPGRYF